MPVSRALRRLLRLRSLEEEQRRLALEGTMSELRHLEHVFAAEAERERSGRALVTESARTAVLTDRVAGIEEARSAAWRKEAIRPRIAEKAIECVELREEFLAKRTERLQTETLIDEAEARDAVESERRDQRAVDEWFLARPEGARERQAPTSSGVDRVAEGRPTAGPSQVKAKSHMDRERPMCGEPEGNRADRKLK